MKTGREREKRSSEGKQRGDEQRVRESEGRQRQKEREQSIRRNRE